jgi:hypothetical protein
MTEKLASLQAAHERTNQERQGAVAAEVGELQTALERERERSQAVARENAAMTEKLASLQAAHERTNQERQGAVAAEVGELQTALERERERSQAVARENAAMTEKLASLQAAHERTNQEPYSNGVNRVPSEPSVSGVGFSMSVTNYSRIDPYSSDSKSPLVQRAEELLRSGDVSGARLFLERASQSNDRRALLLLAQTYDPRVLLERGVRGIRGDAKVANELYIRAEMLLVARGSTSPRPQK